MTMPWLSVIGIGEDGLDGLSAAARALIDSAEVLVGGKRHLALIPEPEAGRGVQRVAWASPFTTAGIAAYRGRRTVVLASGDPMWFGVGATLARHVAADEMTVLPHPGAFSLAAARLLWPLQDCACLTVHGRPLEVLALHLAPGAKLLVLSENGATPARIAALLRDHGFGPSLMTVLEHLDGPAERRLGASAADWCEQACADLNIVAVECRAEPGRRVLPRLPGLPDDAFLHDGQLTKREVRAATLAALAPLPGEMLWDVGAGCGSIAIEWMRAGGRAVAVEQAPARIDRIARNAARLGVPGLQLVAGKAPEVLADIADAPDAVFIGGGASAPGVMESCWRALSSGGRLAANAVTVEGEAALLAWHARHGGELTRIAVSRLSPIGAFHGWSPLAPVTLYIGVKP